MNNQVLKEAVQAYHYKRVKQWLIISAIALCGLLICCGCITYAQVKRHYRNKGELATLQYSIDMLNKQWGAQQQQARQLQLLKKESTYFQKHDVAEYLMLISKTIPDNTYLMELEITPEVVRVKGYSSSEIEIQQFVQKLKSAMPGKRIEHESREEAAGLEFEIRISLAKTSKKLKGYSHEQEKSLN